MDSSFTSSPKPFKVLYTSSVSVSTFENFNPSKVSNYLKIISSTGDVQIKTGTPAFVKEYTYGDSLVVYLSRPKM